MDNTADTAQVIIRPPLAWGLAVIVGLALNWLVPLPFLPVDLPAGWLGAMVFVLALALFAWAIVTLTRAGSNVPTNRPTTTVVESGPYRFTRNPIYLGMFLGLIGLAMAAAWLSASPVCPKSGGSGFVSASISVTLS
jgi:protein-S-isoprenylcysteine O-methyltransferase Ste14